MTEITNDKNATLPKFAFEQYELILKHEYIDEHGKKHSIDEPICARYINAFSTGTSVMYNLMEMMDKLTRTVLNKVGERFDRSIQ